MKQFATAFLVAAATAVLGACAHQGGGHGGMHHGGDKPQGAPGVTSAIYWCGCAPDGKCASVSLKPARCADGSEAAGGHVIFVEGNTALVCTCGPTCACKIDPNDRTKCPCGKPVQRVSLEGTGIHFCNCGGSCACNSLSESPGRCGTCGMQLHPAR